MQVKQIRTICFSILIWHGFLFAQNKDDFGTVDGLLIARRYQDAANILENEIKMDSTNVDVLYKLALAYQGMYRFSKASPILIEASRLNSNNIEILITLAQNYKQLGNDRLAASVYAEVIEKDPGNEYASNELGKLLIENQNYQPAEEIYTELIEKDTTNSYYCKQLAFCRYKLEKTDEAIKLAQESLAIAEENYSTDHPAVAV